MNGQRVTNAVATIHRSLGYLNSCSHRSNGCDNLCAHICNSSDSVPEAFNTLNYSDDMAGVQASFSRASLSFEMMGTLLEELGLSESLDKAVAPCQIITYLGIQFNSNKLEMSVNDEKCTELKALLETSLGF